MISKFAIFYKRYSTRLLLGTALLLVVLVAIFLSEFAKRDDRIRVAAAQQRAAGWRTQLASYYSAHGRMPGSISLSAPQFVFNPKTGTPEMQQQSAYTLEIESGTITITFSSDQGAVAGKTLVYQPRFEGKNVKWDCSGGTVGRTYRASECPAE